MFGLARGSLYRTAKVPAWAFAGASVRCSTKVEVDTLMLSQHSACGPLAMSEASSTQRSLRLAMMFRRESNETKSPQRNSVSIV